MLNTSGLCKARNTTDIRTDSDDSADLCYVCDCDVLDFKAQHVISEARSLALIGRLDNMFYIHLMGSDGKIIVMIAHIKGLFGQKSVELSHSSLMETHQPDLYLKMIKQKTVVEV